MGKGKVIRFKRGVDYAKEDKNIFNDWESHAIPTVIACRRIAKNNGLEYVSEEDFIETARSLGYFRRDWENGDEED